MPPWPPTRLVPVSVPGSISLAILLLVSRDGSYRITGPEDKVLIPQAIYCKVFDPEEGVHFTDLGQELVAQPFPFRRAFDQARDIDELHGGGDHLLRLDDSGQFHAYRWCTDWRDNKTGLA